MDKIRLLADLGQAVRQARKTQRLKAVDVAARAGRSRDVLHRLERGEDVTVSALLDLLRAMDVCLRLERAGLPTLEEMQARFAPEALEDEEGPP